ncbi:DUF2934 domain-containing protein [Lichenibacterium ramalinae]|nr:DUF2934 domain-containing protein [Lichenibacterium ramalinae]
MNHSNDAAIRARAYQLWQESGYADGSQDAHWRQAEREVAARAQAGEDRHGTDPNGTGPSGADRDGEAAASRVRPRGTPGRHSDGMSTFPSVLDPAPAK